MSQLKFVFGILVAVSFVGRVQAQTTGSTPPPPPPGHVDSPPLEGPATDLKPIREESAAQQPKAADDAEGSAVTHDALRTGQANDPANRVHSPKEPPPPIAERPSGRRPGRQAVWVPGYWDWDAARGEFVWMGGLWQVAPAGTIWVGSRWVRDADGWYRRPGVWSKRRGALVETTAELPNYQPPWRKTGPPADHPADAVADAPGPDYFLIAGHYAPKGDELRWKGSFWAKAQPGWDWIPARWVRRPAEWEFRAGHWMRERGPVDVNVKVGGRTAARVVTPGFAPESNEPNEVNVNPDGTITEPPLPPGTEDERDPIAEAEATGRVRVVVPGTVPYYMIRPPGYPYGPGGVFVPGAVPPFVRRILNQVLP